MAVPPEKYSLLDFSALTQGEEFDIVNNSNGGF
jgi:hypothetical protein